MRWRLKAFIDHPRPCPFCGTIRPCVFKTNGRFCPMSFIECYGCKAQGPTGLNLKEAVKLWNLRK